MTIQEIVDMANGGHKIEAIKALRSEGLSYEECPHGYHGQGHYYADITVVSGQSYCNGTGLSLKQAKDIVELLMGITVPISREEHDKYLDDSLHGWANKRINELQTELAKAQTSNQCYQEELSNEYRTQNELATDLYAAQERVRQLETFIVDQALKGAETA